MQCCEFKEDEQVFVNRFLINAFTAVIPVHVHDISQGVPQRNGTNILIYLALFLKRWYSSGFGFHPEILLHEQVSYVNQRHHM